MFQRIAVIVFAGLLLGADTKDAKKDTDKVQGTWQVTALTRDGEAMPKEEAEKARLIIKGDKFTFKASDGDHEGSYTLDAKANPKSIDITPTGGGDVKGIYSVTDTEFKLCFSIGGERPKAFESKANSGVFLMIMKKAKE